jgi:tellurite resistance protein TerC
MDQTLLLWGGFVAFVVAMLALDIGVFHRRPHVVGMREALTWTGVWIVLALLFNACVWYWFGTNAALEFFTGYLVEKSLSIDNVFVFVLLFSYFDTPAAYHHKVLFLGILGAIVARTIFIVGGLALLASFHWTIYVFGAFLVATGISMVWKKQDYTPDRNPIIRLARAGFLSQKDTRTVICSYPAMVAGWRPRSSSSFSRWSRPTFFLRLTPSLPFFRSLVTRSSCSARTSSRCWV